MTSASLKLPAGLDAVGDGWFPLTAAIGCWLLPPQPMRTRAQASAGATTNVRVRVRMASPSGLDPIKAVTEASARYDAHHMADPSTSLETVPGMACGAELRECRWPTLSFETGCAVPEARVDDCDLVDTPQSAGSRLPGRGVGSPGESRPTSAPIVRSNQPQIILAASRGWESIQKTLPSSWTISFLIGGKRSYRSSK